MWFLRSTRKNISQDTLSEYLDGRLQGRVLEVVAGALAAVFLVGLFLRWRTTRRDLG